MSNQQHVNHDTTEAVFEDIGRLLNLDRKAVGMGFVKTAHQFSDEDSPELKAPMSYCNIVRLASKGYRFKAKHEHILCPGAAKALGMVAPTEEAKSGAIYHAMGLYDSIGVAKSVQSHVTYMDVGTYGIVVQPMEAWTRMPDVVLIIANPYQCMRILQGYAHFQGVPKNIKMIGNAGICSECTATPFKTQDINVSLLCSNTRFAAKWRDEEMGIGIPAAQYHRICEGIVNTLGACEPRGRKNIITENYQGAYRDRVIQSLSRKTYFEK